MPGKEHKKSPKIPGKQVNLLELKINREHGFSFPDLDVEFDGWIKEIMLLPGGVWQVKIQQSPVVPVICKCCGRGLVSGEVVMHKESSDA